MATLLEAVLADPTRLQPELAAVSEAAREAMEKALLQLPPKPMGAQAASVIVRAPPPSGHAALLQGPIKCGGGAASQAAHEWKVTEVNGVRYFESVLE